MQEELVARRGRMDIVADILRVAKEGVKKTQIVSRAGLNHKLCEKYLNFMVRRGWLEVTKGGRYALYSTSDKGLEYLNQYDKLEEFFT